MWIAQAQVANHAATNWKPAWDYHRIVRHKITYPMVHSSTRITITIRRHYEIYGAIEMYQVSYQYQKLHHYFVQLCLFVQTREYIPRLKAGLKVYMYHGHRQCPRNRYCYPSNCTICSRWKELVKKMTCVWTITWLTYPSCTYRSEGQRTADKWLQWDRECFAKHMFSFLFRIFIIVNHYDSILMVGLFVFPEAVSWKLVDSNTGERYSFHNSIVIYTLMC